MTTAHELARFEDDGGPVRHETRPEVECARCRALVETYDDLGLHLATHGPARDPCPASRLSLAENEEAWEAYRDAVDEQC